MGLRQFYKMFRHHDHVTPKGPLLRVDHQIKASCIHKNKIEHFKHLDMIDFEECTNCQARVQVQGLSQISNKRPGPGA